MPARHSPLLVIGLGNPLRGDDAVGWMVAGQVQQQLAKEEYPVEVAYMAVGGIGLMERLAGYEQVILIDAVTTGQRPPGSLYVLSVDDLPHVEAGHLSSSHDTTFQTAFSLGRALGLALPETILIFGVEAAPVFDFTEQLTPAVAAAVPQLTRMIIASLFRWLQEEPQP